LKQRRASFKHEGRATTTLREQLNKYRQCFQSLQPQSERPPVGLKKRRPHGSSTRTSWPAATFSEAALAGRVLCRNKKAQPASNRRPFILLLRRAVCVVFVVGKDAND